MILYSARAPWRIGLGLALLLCILASFMLARAEQSPVELLVPPSARQDASRESLKQRAERETALNGDAVRAPSSGNNMEHLRAQARTLKGGCAHAITSYLRRLHEERRELRQETADARAALHAARLHHPSNLPHAERQLALAKDALRDFDTETLRIYGTSLPKTCVREVEQDVPMGKTPATMESVWDLPKLVWQTAHAHLVLFHRTWKGVWAYTVASYIPMLRDFEGFADVFYRKAVHCFHEAHPQRHLWDKLTGKSHAVPTMEFAWKVLQGLGYACVPLLLLAFIAALVVLLFPLLLFGVVVPDYLYNVWTRLFIFYYTYGITSPGQLIGHLRQLWGALRAKDWGTCRELFEKAVLGSLTNFNEMYYNTVLMAQMVIIILMILFVLLWSWFNFFIRRPPRHPKVRKSIALQPENNTRSSRKSKVKSKEHH